MNMVRHPVRRLRGLCPDTSELKELGRPIALILALSAIARFDDVLVLPKLESDEFIRALAIGWIALLFTTFGHELAHAVVGRRLGFRLYRFRVGPFVLSGFENGVHRTRLKIEPGSHSGGSISVTMPLHLTDDEASRRYRILLRAGSVGSIIACIILLVVAASGTPQGPYARLAVLVACGYSCVNQWRFSRPGQGAHPRSDGGMILELDKNPGAFIEESRAGTLVTNLLAAIQRNTLGSDWPADLVEPARTLVDFEGNPRERQFFFARVVAWILFWYELDRDNDEQAWAYGATFVGLIDRARNADVEINDDAAFTAAFICASLSHDRERVFRLDAPPKHPDDPRDNVLQKMTDAALLQLEGDLDRTEAELRAIRAELLARDRLDIGDRGLLRMIDQMEEHIRSGPTGEPWAARFLPAAIESAA